MSENPDNELEAKEVLQPGDAVVPNDRLATAIVNVVRDWLRLKIPNAGRGYGDLTPKATALVFALVGAVKSLSRPEGPLEFYSMVSAQTGAPLLRVVWGDREEQMEAADARRMALDVLDAVHAAEMDAYMFAFIVDTLGLAKAAGYAMLTEFRNYRDRQALLQQRPPTPSPRPIDEAERAALARVAEEARESAGERAEAGPGPACSSCGAAIALALPPLPGATLLCAACQQPHMVPAEMVDAARVDLREYSAQLAPDNWCPTCGQHPVVLIARAAGRPDLFLCECGQLSVPGKSGEGVLRLGEVSSSQ